MKRNTIKFLSVIFMIASLGTAYGQLSVPDYSFSGNEITGFTVAPGYTTVNFDFKLPSRMDVYLQKQISEVDLGDKGNYRADDPGIMYSSQSATSFSSLFVGAKAFRNNIVKMYLEKRYIEAINTYEKYAEKIEKSEFAGESKLLYGLSLYETGNHKAAIKLLTEIAGGGGEFAELAQDNLFTVADNLNRFDIMENVASTAPSLSAYSFGIWLKNLYARNHYDAVLTYLNKYPSYEKQYPELKNLRLSSLYFLKRYKEASDMVESVRGMASFPLAADSFVMIGDDKKAEILTADIADSGVRNVILAKIDISRNNFPSATKRMKDIQTDSEKLALLLYAVSAKFEQVPIEFMSGITFKDKQQSDYKNFYMGLKYLADKKNTEALNKLSLVAFNKDLIRNAYFYRGMAAAPIDRARSEWNFNKYIGSGDEPEKVMLSKFMLAQIYFMDKKKDEALMLIDDCKTNYCTRLKADIMLADNKFNKSIEITKGLTDERSSLIRANAYYNLKDYDKVLKELGSVKTKTPDSEYLLMMSLFKTKRIDDAENVLKMNVKDKRIMAAGVEQLILAGAGDKALSFIDKNEDISPEYRFERAKLLLAANRVPEAEKAFKALIAANTNIYGAMQGLFDIARANDKGKEFVAESKPFIEKSVNFDNKDLLVSKFASYAAENDEANLAIGYVNYFTDNFKDSPYMFDVRRTRASLFKFTGRFDNCVADADALIAQGGVQTEDALFLKAECMENIDKNKAIEIYRTMFSEKNRFFQPSATRIAEISDDPVEILSASQKIRSFVPEVYEKGAVRFLEKIPQIDIPKFKADITKMAASDTDAVRSAALWRLGVDFADNKNQAEAARYFLKSYYLFPKTAFASKSLEGAKKSYEARGMKKEAAKAGDLLKTITPATITATDNKTKETKK